MDKLLNLGCGSRFHSDWTNIDFISKDDKVISCNLRQGIPYTNNSFDVVYHSHLLEHFSKIHAEKFLKECFRVLKKNGIIRVAVPDLEQIVLVYLMALEKAEQESLQWAKNYDWILLEMYDQTVRNVSGGDMASYLYQEPIPNYQFILDRCGSEIKKITKLGTKNRLNSQEKIKNKINFLVERIVKIKHYPKYLKELLIKLVLGKEYQALQIGRFRQSGEVHQWMYDRYSLALLLKKCGFEQIVKRSAYESYIPNWTSFNLDTEPDGTVYKPDSLFMEAIKPSV